MLVCLATVVDKLGLNTHVMETRYVGRRKIIKIDRLFAILNWIYRVCLESMHIVWCNGVLLPFLKVLSNIVIKCVGYTLLKLSHAETYFSPCFEMPMFMLI